MKLAINEMFVSLDGEVNPWGQGTPTIFLRLQGCNMNCPYCDTKYAQCAPDETQFVEVDKIVEKINKIGCKRVTITGGEPLIQQESLLELVNYLDLHGYQITIETNGSILISENFSCYRCGGQLSFIIDCKLHALNEMVHHNYYNARDCDWVKIVVANPSDCQKAVLFMTFLKNTKNLCQAKFAFSPMAGKITAAELAEWILENKLWDVTLNTQLHKIIWPNANKKHSEGRIIL